MSGQGRTEETEAGCKQRCKDTSGCNYYNNFPNGGCHLSTGRGGTKIDQGNPTIGSGSKDCSSDPNTNRDTRYNAVNDFTI